MADDTADSGQPAAAGRVRTTIPAEEWAISHDGSLLRVSGGDITVDLPLDDDILDAIHDLTELPPDDDLYDEYDELEDEDEDDELAVGERAARVSGWKAFNSHWETTLPSSVRSALPIGLVIALVLTLVISTML